MVIDSVERNSYFPQYIKKIPSVMLSRLESVILAYNCT